MQISKITPFVNNSYPTNKNSSNNSNTPHCSNVSFTGKPPIVSKFFIPLKMLANSLDKVYDAVAIPIAKEMGKLLDTKPAAWLIETTIKHPNFNDKLISHLTAFSSAILSGFYIQRTLGNDKLDPEKKKTLAINQAAVWATSTVMCYTTDGLINNQVNRFTERFKIINMNKNIDTKILDNCTNGIKAAKSMMVFGLIYRYIAPVLVTPIANKIANRIQEKKETELAASKKIVA